MLAQPGLHFTVDKKVRTHINFYHLTCSTDADSC